MKDPDMTIIQPTNKLKSQFTQMAMEFSRDDLDSFFKLYSAAMDDFGYYVRSLICPTAPASAIQTLNYWIIDSAKNIIASAQLKHTLDSSDIDISLSIRPSKRDLTTELEITNMLDKKITQMQAEHHQSNMPVLSEKT